MVTKKMKDNHFYLNHIDRKIIDKASSKLRMSFSAYIRYTAVQDAMKHLSEEEIKSIEMEENTKPKSI